MASFTPFPRLPYELRRQIWTFAIPEPESEVCVVWPLVLVRGSTGSWEEPALPLTVDTAWPTVMHTCREGRDATLTSGRLPLRRSAAAGGIDVPYRSFDPAIDTLYWGDAQTDAVREFLVENHEHGVPVARVLRHVAVDARGLYPMGFLAEIVRQAAVDLKSLTLVLPSSRDKEQTVTVAVLPPARRCRLRDIPAELSEEITMVRLPSFGPTMRTPDMPLAAFMGHVRDEMNYHVRAFDIGGPDGTAWSTADSSFGGLVLKAQTFVEYGGGGGAAAGRRVGGADSDASGSCWVEVCGGRKMDVALGRHHRPPRIAASDRRNPEKHRVIEDDCRIQPLSASGSGYSEDPW